MDKQFTWIPFYMELADKLRGFAEDRTELLNVITQIYEKLGIPLPTLEKDGMLPVDIDPFTFIGLFNKGIKDSTRMEIIKIIAELFCIKADIPTDFNGIPVLSNMNAVFYHFIGERGEHDIDNLWKVFSAAIDYSDKPSDESRAEFCKYYDLVLKQKGIKRNLSIGLFWIRPYDYLSLDSRNLEFMGNSDDLSDEFSGSIAALKGSAPSAEGYLQLCETCRNELASGQQEYKDFPALSYYVWINGKNEEQEWWPSLDEYDPGFTVEDWINLLGNKKVFDENSLIVIKAFYDAGGESICKEVAKNSDHTMDFYRNVSVSLAKRIHKATNCPLGKHKDGSDSWWAIPFVGKNAGKKQTGVWIWRLRDELKEAIMRMSDKFEKNNTAELSLEEKKAICGLYFARLPLGQKGKSGPGYNKEMKDIQVALGIPGDNPIRNVRDIYDYYFNNREGYKDKKMSPCQQLIYDHFKTYPIDKLRRIVDAIKNHQEYVFDYNQRHFLNEVFMTDEEYNKLAGLLRNKKNVILQGAPGVGKTFTAKRLAYSIMGEKDPSRVAFVQFHQSYSYEDFIMGYRPAENGNFKLISGVFYEFCKTAAEDPDRDYFFIIDEINRGNLSKIFGELLMLIESDKRGPDHSIDLVYGARDFYVPENLYIIGMMNTADRSLAMIDYALRRRFGFYSMKPAFENAGKNGFADYTAKVDCELYKSAVAQVVSLNQTIRKELGEGFEIGHSYFSPENTSVINDDWVRNVIEFELLPLIDEYCFDDKEKGENWSAGLRGLLEK